jgi:hypothetical protein
VGRFLAASSCALVLGLLPAQASALPAIHHVFVIVEENESASTTFGSGSPAPYLSQTLVSSGAYVPNYYGIGHASLDNYIAMVSGQAPNPSTRGDCPTFSDFAAPTSMDASGQENGQGCVYPADVPTLMSQMDNAHLTWRGYMDGMGTDPVRESSTCGHPVVGSPDPTQLGESAPPYDEYATRHDPFVYFHYVIDNSTECNANVVGLNQLTTDLQSVSTTPNYVFITPNLCNDGHDTPCKDGTGVGGLKQVDQFLKTWVPKIGSSPAYQQDGLLIIIFDEASGDSSACCSEKPGPYDASKGNQPGGTGPGGGDVGAVLLSRFIKPGTTTSVSYNHYSLLGTVEDIFGLPRLGDAVGATPFGSDIFTPPPPAVTAAQISALDSGQIKPTGKPAKIKAVLANGGYAMSLRALEAGQLSLQWSSKSHALLASGSTSFTAAGTTTVKIALTKAGRKLLKKTRKKLTVLLTETFTPAGAGSPPVTSTASTTLRR